MCELLPSRVICVVRSQSMASFFICEIAILFFGLRAARPATSDRPDSTLFVRRYSFALVAWQLFSLQPPFAELSAVDVAFAVAEMAARPLMPDSCPIEVADLIVACWSQRLEERPTFEQLVRALEWMPVLRPHLGSTTFINGMTCSTANQPLDLSPVHWTAGVELPTATTERAAVPATRKGSAYYVPDEMMPQVPGPGHVARIGVQLYEVSTLAPVAAARASNSNMYGEVMTILDPSVPGIRLFSFDLNADENDIHNYRNCSSFNGTPSDVFGTDRSSPKSERKRVVLDEECLLQYNDAKRSSPTLEARSAPFDSTSEFLTNNVLL